MTIGRGQRRRGDRVRRLRGMRWVLVALPVLAMVGCRSPSKANIELRKQNADLRQQVAELTRRIDDQKRTIKTLEAQRNTVAVLPDERLAGLFVVSELRLGRLSGGGDTDPHSPGDEVLRVVAAPVDAEGHTLKAAGRFVIELFEVGDEPKRIGQWDLEDTETRHRWIDSGLVYGYLFELPWQQSPTMDRLLLRVQFEDALTQRIVRAERIIEVNPPQAADQ